ncbi:MAG TPA: 23S rRNA (adenine(2503)-C(2))-methyltransferase RlmN [Candidatus Eisenbacteria bacterium]|nr:23S rRNA (adenine(2503)-C(2))-methyltransferase RlmN [Candidatus Eisenbacteria bacterium]
MKTDNSAALPRTSPNFYGLSRADLAARLEGLGEPSYRADQIYSWVYRQHLRDASGMSDLPAKLRQGFADLCRLELPAVGSVLGTRDGMTQKFVLTLDDGARVESVSMRTEKRLTFCLSSQVGCALGCTFCATGLMGLQRNLTAAEIVAQVMAMGDYHRWKDDRFNLVFMGMGEPLANYAPMMEAIRILHDPMGLGLGARRITVSTSGVVPQIRRLAEEGLPVGLAVSLHATTDELRTRLVPINKRWPLAELIPAARDYGARTGRRVTLEYTVLAGVNDRDEDADRLGALARELPSKINLIAYNPVPGLEWKRPTAESLDAFAKRLWPIAPAVTVRHTQGGEIWAACGQLGGLSPAA